MNITFEERQLMSLYNTGTRTGLIAALEEMRGYLAADETELRELTDSAIAKLRRMSDAEYDALDLFPDFEKEDMDVEESTALCADGRPHGGADHGKLPEVDGISDHRRKAV